MGLLSHLRPRVPPTQAEAAQGMAHQAALSTAGILVQGAVRFVYSVLVGNVLGQYALGSLNAGILGACFQAVDFGYRVVIPRDGVIGTPQAYVDAVFEHTLALLARITRVDELIAVWQPAQPLHARSDGSR